MPGVLVTGFEKKSLQEILDELSTEQKAKLGPALNTQADSVVGQLNGVIGAKLAELWELAQAVYNSQYPGSASGSALDNVAAITGAQRLAATKSAVIVRATGVNGTIIPINSVVATAPAGDRFKSTAPATIAGGIADIPFEAEQFGPVLANAGTLTDIKTPVGGWATATNLADAILGRNQETDEAFRQRRLQLLQLPGDATLDAIRAALLNVANVEQAFIYENDTDVTTDGIPPHSIECVVVGGDDDEIAQAIYDTKSAGIRAFGAVTTVIADSQNHNHTIGFSRPTDLVYEMNVTVVKDVATFPADGANQIKTAVAAYINALKVGEDVIRNKLFDIVFDACPGIVDVTVLEHHFDPPGGAYVTSNLAVSPREIATSDTAAIVVTVT